MIRKLTVAVATALLALSSIGVAAPADAKDSSWGCGGACRHTGR